MDPNNQPPNSNSGRPRFIHESMIPSGEIKPNHLVATPTSTVGVPLSDGSKFNFATLATFFPFVTGAKYVPIFGSNLPIGDNDLYTVPSGKKLLLYGSGSQQFANFHNSSGGSITFYAEFKTNGSYYRMRSNTTLSAGTSTILNLGSSPLILNAGETFSINTATTAGLNVSGSGLLFDATNTNIVGARILNLLNGYNTLYTVPLNKSAILLGSLISTGSGITVTNASGGSLNYFVNYIPLGSAAASTNQIFAAFTVANNSAGLLILGTALSSGDSLAVNTSGGGTGQVAWTTVLEI